MDKKKIIIVDDNPDFRYMVKKGLEKLTDKYEIFSVESGFECFNLMKNIDKPSLILLDIMMPGIDGWDVFAQIKEHREWRDIPILFVSAKNDPYSIGFGKINAEMYIEKPFKIEDLNDKIKEIIG